MQHKVFSVFARASLVAVVTAMAAGSAMAASPEADPSAPRGAAAQGSADTTARDGAGSDPAPSRNAARSRMRECGHQWSAMKKNGSASGMTWKDFSQGCLAKQ